jgi:hypothetical protein
MGVQSNSRFEAFDGSATPRATTLAFNQVGMGYFRTMTTKILDGREFDRTEHRRDVCVLTQGAARALFPGQPTLGQYVRTPANAGLDLQRGGAGGGRVEGPAVACRVIGSPRTPSSAACARRRR